MLICTSALFLNLVLATAPEQLAIFAELALVQPAEDQRQTTESQPEVAQKRPDERGPDDLSGSLSQTPPEESKPPSPGTGLRALLRGYFDDVANLPSVENLYVTIMGGAGAVAVHPVDASFNTHLQSHYALVNSFYIPAKYYGATLEQVGLALAAYGFGRLSDKPKVSHVGMDLLRAQMLTETLVGPLKLATHRERPDGSNRQSFPSGHAAVTFAGATVIERHLGWRKSALAYVVAAYVATSRLHDNRHYASDVLFGAAAGTIAGRTVTRHGADDWAFVPISVPGGVLLVLSRHR